MDPSRTLGDAEEEGRVVISSQAVLGRVPSLPFTLSGTLSWFIIDGQLVAARCLYVWKNGCFVRVGGIF